MKRVFFLGAAVTLTLAFASCQKEAGFTSTQAQTHTTATKTIPGTNYFKFYDWEQECGPQPGNCIPWTKRSSRNPQMIRTITEGNPATIAEYFAANRSELITLLPAEQVDWVINGACTVSYKQSSDMTADWYVFKDGDVVLDYVRMPIGD